MLPIERSSFILLCQQPVADWINALPREEGQETEDITTDMLNSQPPVYLVELFETPDSMDDAFQSNWPKMWESFLAGWSPDTSKWPQERTLDGFGQWFQVLPTPLVFDSLTTGPGEIEKPHSGIVLP